MPGQEAELTRPAIAAVVGVDLHGHEVRVAATGLLARCLQHEADHLDGSSTLVGCPPMIASQSSPLPAWIPPARFLRRPMALGTGTAGDEPGPDAVPLDDALA